MVLKTCSTIKGGKVGRLTCLLIKGKGVVKEQEARRVMRYKEENK